MKKIICLILMIGTVIAIESLTPGITVDSQLSDQEMMDLCLKTMQQFNQDPSSCDDVMNYQETLKQHPELTKAP